MSEFPMPEYDTNPAAPSAPRNFEDKAPYRAKVVSQKLIKDFKEVLTLTLQVEIVGKLLDSRDPESSALPLPGFKEPPRPTVRLAFPEDSPERMGYAIQDLAALGWDGDDLEELNPDAGKKAFSLVGRTVIVAPTYKEYNGREDLYWNLRTIRGREEKAVEKGSLKKAPVSEAFRRRKAQLAAAKNPAGEPVGF